MNNELRENDDWIEDLLAHYRRRCRDIDSLVLPTCEHRERHTKAKLEVKRNIQAEEVLIDMLGMIESDLMKAHHYLDKAIQISLIAQPDPELPVHQKIAQISVIVAREIKELQHLTRQLVTPPTKQENK